MRGWKKTKTGDKRIASVYNNLDKQTTYREQLGKYKVALEHEFYFEAMLIVYAMMEDRMRSFLYHIGAFRQPDARQLNVSKTKGDLRRLYFGSDEAAENKKLTFDNISCKEKMIRATLNWAISSDSPVSGTYLDVLRSEYQKCLDMDGFLNTLDHIDQWLKYRNEVIHGLFNKNAACLNESIREEVEAGMRYARFIDSQVKALKKKDAIRTKMRIRP